ncbi:MAG: DnaB-like helicase C-terminal domain-containing protein [Acutalibacteraceae bacterium]
MRSGSRRPAAPSRTVDTGGDADGCRQIRRWISRACWTRRRPCLGSMLIDSRCVGAVLAEVRWPEYITQPTYRMIFDAITAPVCRQPQRSTRSRCRPRSRAAGREHTAMYDLVSKLMQTTPTAANVGEYVRILKQRARLMSLKDLASEILGAESEDDIAQLLDRANAIMVSRPGSVRTATMAEAYREFFARHDPDVKAEYLRWGIQELDDAIYAGPGDMVVIGGYPSDGKNHLCSLSTAFRMAEKKKVGFFSYETDKDKLYDRIVASVAQIGLAKLKLNALSRNDWDTMAAIGQKLAGPKLQLIPRPSGMTVQDISQLGAVARILT